MHPNWTRKGKINPNDLNVPQEHGTKTRKLIHNNRYVIANSDEKLVRTQSFQMKTEIGNHYQKN